MKKLFCVVLLALFALPAMANTPIKKEVKTLSKEVKMSKIEIDMSSKEIDTTDKKDVKNANMSGCPRVTLSCGVSGGICADSYTELIFYIWIAEDMHCNFE
jgi:hypothetical protein